MIVKLTDFSSGELQTLLNALASQAVDLKNKIEIQKQYDIDLGIDYEEELSVNQMLVVQVINAKVEVRSREIVDEN